MSQPSSQPGRECNTYYVSAMNEQAAVRLRLILPLPSVIKWIFNPYLLPFVSQEYA